MTIAAHQRLLRRVRVGVDDHVVARRPLGQLVRSCAGGVGLQPGVAEIAVRLVRHRPSSCRPRCRHWRVRQYSTKLVASASPAASSPACSRPAHGSSSRRCPALKPNWVTMKPGVLFSLTTRCRLNAASCAVTGLPESNFASRRSLKVKVRPSLLTSHFSARSPSILVASFRSGPDQPAVAVGVHLAVGEFVRFRRIEADDVVDLLGHHRDALGRGGARAGQHGGRGDGRRPRRPAECVGSAW